MLSVSVRCLIKSDTKSYLFDYMKPNGDFKNELQNENYVSKSITTLCAYIEK